MTPRFWSFWKQTHATEFAQTQTQSHSSNRHSSTRTQQQPELAGSRQPVHLQHSSLPRHNYLDAKIVSGPYWAHVSMCVLSFQQKATDILMCTCAEPTLDCNVTLLANSTVLNRISDVFTIDSFVVNNRDQAILNLNICNILYMSIDFLHTCVNQSMSQPEHDIVR